MALKRLSIAEMVERTADLLSTKSAEHQAILAVPTAEAMLPQIQLAYDGLIAAQPPNDGIIAELTRLLGLLDAEHDDLARALDGRLTSELISAMTDEIRARLTRTRGALFPKGLTVVSLSYAAQAGAAKLRAPRITADIRKTLAKMKTYDGRTLEQLYDRFQAVAKEIGAADKRRADLGEEGAVIARAGEARNRWIRTINALAAVLAAAEVDERPILGRIRDAELAAEPRSSTTEGAAPVTSLDPPVPTDATDPDAPDPETQG